MAIFLSKSEQDVVVFHLFKSLNYRLRLLISLTLVLGGLAMQYLMYEIFPGVIIVFWGTLLLLVKGYDNRIKLGRFTPYAKWEKANSQRLDELEELHKRMKKWDRSTIDITSGWGFVFFFVLLLTTIIFFVQGSFYLKSYAILASNIIALLLPFWVTGAKKILTRPTLLIKIRLIKQVIRAYAQYLQEHRVEYHILLKGKEKGDQVLPEDVKFRVVLKDQKPELLGLYGQVTTNDVSGTKYPYFYVVIVVKEGFNIREKTKNYQPPKGIIKEYTKQKDVEVLIIRQHTTKTSGYHTKPRVVSAIFAEGMRQMLELNK